MRFQPFVANLVCGEVFFLTLTGPQWLSKDLVKKRQCTVSVILNEWMKRRYTAFFFPIANLTENWQCTVFALNSPNRWEWKCRDGTLPFFFQQQTLVSYVAKQNSDVYDTGSSQAVPHPSTIPARQCLTSVIERERVFHCGMTVDKCLMNVC